MFSPTTRRGFLGRASALAAGAFGLLADPFGIVGHSSRGAAGEQAQPPPDQVGELYAGFVLVRPGEPHPAALTLPKVGPPILEQIGGGPLPTGHTQTITRAEADALGVELWTLRGMPATSFEATFTGTNLFTLALLSDVASEGFSTLTVVCQPNFPKPYPVMPQGPPDLPVLAQKTEQTPQPGILFRSGVEVVAQWTEGSGLYTAIARLADQGAPAPVLTFVKA